MLASCSTNCNAGWLAADQGKGARQRGGAHSDGVIDRGPQDYERAHLPHYHSSGALQDIVLSSSIPRLYVD